jgi:RNA polymerase sigma-70 factor (ECF subfamily)
MGPGWSGGSVRFYRFDEEYVSRLRAGDDLVRAHFASYFGELIHLKLRRRIRSSELIEDVRQETLFRVLRFLAQNGDLQHPERLGAFVSTVCRNVLLEHLRADSHDRQGAGKSAEPLDEQEDPEQLLVTAQGRRQVRQILALLPERDRGLLRMIFYEERDKSEVCRLLGVNRNYLRTLLLRARRRFQRSYLQATRRPVHPTGLESSIIREIACIIAPRHSGSHGLPHQTV